jgi:O-antigen ligase
VANAAARRDALLCAPAALLLFVLPFAHVTALRQTALALTAAAAVWAWRRDPGPPVPLKLPLALWLGMALLSLAWARNPAYSLGEIRSEIVYGIVYFLAFFALTRERRHWNIFRGALLAGLFTLAAIAVWIYARFRTLDADSYLGGVLSISSYLVTLFPMVLVGAFEFRENRRFAGWALAAALAVLLVGYLTFNRMFILAIDVCIVAVAAGLARRHILRRPGLVAAAVAVLLVASVAFFYSVAEQRAQTYWAGKTVHATMQDDPRWQAWTFSIGLIREHPFTGTGFGLFAGQELYNARFHSGMEGANTHAHNPFLNYAVQMGLEGLAVLCLLLYCVFREFWKLWRSDHAQAGLVGATGLAMTLAVVIKAQPDDLWGRHNGYLFWALTGMMLGYAHRLLRAPGQPGPARA